MSPIFFFLPRAPQKSGPALHAPRFIPVACEPPPLHWVQVNTDGSFHNLQRAGFGGIFRGALTSFLEAFSFKISAQSGIEVEILAVIEAIRIAWLKGWVHLWIETDPSLVVHYFKAPKLVPWRLDLDFLG